ncbi:uncharacterized protein RNJ42_02281 [Nakaseomyces bracarensis]|uniref:uncharacterized protein n=1 Tax=Nakaseomyces bracarensis TaxID=273131 RepID=UPI003871FC28
MCLINLFFVFFILFWSDLVESQSVRVLLGGDESDPVSQLVLLQVLLGQVLQVLTRELGGGNNGNNGTIFFDGDSVTQVTDNTFNLDVVDQVLSVRSWVEDTVFSWSRDIDGKGVGDLLLSSGLYKTFYTNIKVILV